MKIVTTCYSCGKETTIASPRWIRTVVDFEMEKKFSFFHKCDSCKKNNKTNVNQVTAKVDKFGFAKLTLGFIAVVIIASWALDNLWILLLLFFLLLFWEDEKENVKEFNKSKEEMKRKQKST